MASISTTPCWSWSSASPPTSGERQGTSQKQLPVWFDVNLWNCEDYLCLVPNPVHVFYTFTSIVWGLAAWTSWASSSLWVTVKWPPTWSMRARSWSDGVTGHFTSATAMQRWKFAFKTQGSFFFVFFVFFNREKEAAKDWRWREQTEGEYKKKYGSTPPTEPPQGASRSLDDTYVACCRSGRSVMATREKTTQLETGAAMKWRRPVTQTLWRPATTDVSPPPPLCLKCSF